MDLRQSAGEVSRRWDRDRYPRLASGVDGGMTADGAR